MGVYDSDSRRPDRRSRRARQRRAAPVRRRDARRARPPWSAYVHFHLERRRGAQFGRADAAERRSAPIASQQFSHGHLAAESDAASYMRASHVPPCAWPVVRPDAGAVRTRHRGLRPRIQLPPNADSTARLDAFERLLLDSAPRMLPRLLGIMAPAMLGAGAEPLVGARRRPVRRVPDAHSRCPRQPDHRDGPGAVVAERRGACGRATRGTRCSTRARGPRGGPPRARCHRSCSMACRRFWLSTASTTRWTRLTFVLNAVRRSDAHPGRSGQLRSLRRSGSGA